MFGDACQIWVARVADVVPYQTAVEAVLTSAERADLDRRGARSSTTRLSRAVLRLLLAGYLDIASGAVEIDRTCLHCGQPHGKPRLVPPPGGRPAIEFSVSHGGDLLVYAFADHTPVGVDVEPLSTVAVDADLWDFTLTPGEREQVSSLPAEQRTATFLRYWTAKEAVLKALGTGLSVEPQAVTLPPLLPNGVPVTGSAVVTREGSPPARLQITRVDVGHGHLCSVATRHPRRVRVSQLSPAALLDPGRR